MPRSDAEVSHTVSTCWLGRYTVSLLAINTITIAYLTLAPELVGALVDCLHITPERAGLITSAQLTGSAVGASCVLLGWLRLPVAQRLWLSVLGMATCDLTCAFLTSAPALIVCRGLSGTAAGVGFATVTAAVSCLPRPTLVYGATLVAQMLFGIIGYLSMPLLLEHIGLRGIFISLAGLGTLAGLFMTGSSDSETRSSTAVEGNRRPLDPAIVLLLFSLSCVFLARAAIWTYLERIGVAAGLSARAIAIALALSMAAGLIGAVMASVMSSAKTGRAMVAGVSMMAASTVLLFGSASASVYTLAAAGFNGTLMYVLPFYLAAFARAPPGERHVTIASVIVFAGLGLGPLIGSRLLVNSSYNWLIGSAAVGFVVAVLLTVVADLWIATRGRYEQAGISA